MMTIIFFKIMTKLVPNWSENKFAKGFFEKLHKIQIERLLLISTIRENMKYRKYEKYKKYNNENNFLSIQR